MPLHPIPRSLDAQYHRIQKAAGIHLPCSKEEAHTCTPTCHLYGFHDLQRGFATMNAAALSADAVQTLMRHRSYTTTQRYINLARQMGAAVEALHVLDVLKGKIG